MSLTAREWLLLPEEEQKRRADELSPHECFRLRTDLEYIHFTEEQKRNMSKEEREAFLARDRQLTEEEKRKLWERDMAIFKRMIEEVERKRQQEKE